MHIHSFTHPPTHPPISPSAGLIKRAIDVYRGNQFAGYDYRRLVRTIDLEIAAALANEKREDLPRGSLLTSSPPPPPPPPPPASKQTERSVNHHTRM